MRLPTPLSRRNKNTHKNDFGHALIVAGSPSMLGAAALCALAALRAGAGLVTAGVGRRSESTLQKKLNAGIMTWPLPVTSSGALSAASAPVILKKSKTVSALGIGPGLGRASSTAVAVRKVIAQAGCPAVIDADALTALAQNSRILLKSPAPRILTPHPGEMARLTGLAKSAIEKNRSKTAQNFARKFHCILVLKGHRTVMAGPDGKIYINRTGNAGMATAGSGDVLAGIITAFLAQGIEPFAAARWGVYLHGRAGDLAARAKGKASLIATDLLDFLPAALKAVH